ncbi:MAG: DUF3179 domain-containing protein [Cytophagales bacterium]|nr:MAG: DUF3179 domain-containing protein [Cytophagales bacterium]
MKTLRWPLLGLLLLILLEAARVYFIMPFPGSQLDDAANLNRVAVAYWLHENALWMRAIGLLLLAVPVFQVLKNPTQAWHRWVVGGMLVAYGTVLYMVNLEMMADRMFLQPTTKRMVPMSQNKIPTEKLVLGVVQNGEARAYPIQLIGYHHQVRDSVGGKPVMVTYCTVCRTGRVFDPVVNEPGHDRPGHDRPGRDRQIETFRLVGMDHFNAMFEDEKTGSWWRQATGEAILGERRGEVLRELPTQQLTLAEWAVEHPNTLVLQPDPAFKAETDSLARYDLGTRRSKLTGRDSASWKPKSWVVGVVVDDKAGSRTAKAFDWNELAKQKVINSAVGNQPVVLSLAPDGRSFRVFSRTVNGQTGQTNNGQTLGFAPTGDGQLIDKETGSVWNRAGRATAGPLMGKQLVPVQAYQEFWHSWQSFHPKTSQ